MSADALRELTARFWRVPPATVTDGLRFDATGLTGFSSTRFLTFVAAVERQLGVRIDDPGSLRSFADLVARAGGGRPSAAPAIERAPAAALPIGLQLGHDLEEVRNLPTPADYRTDAFYTRNFTPAELDYCLSQKDPRPHLAARLCAKEAVQKCGPALQALPMGAIEIRPTAAGAPTVHILDEAIRRQLGGARFLVSLTHTEAYASAVVLLLP